MEPLKVTEDIASLYSAEDVPNYIDVIICRYTLLRMRKFTASATALTHLVWLRAGGDNRKHARRAQRKEGRNPG